MKHTLSAAVLTLSLICAAPLLAQAATTTDGSTTTPPEGMHHEGGPGMHHGGPGFGMQAHLVAPVSNAPLTAQFASTSDMKNREGQQVTHSGTESVYRDSLGRTREDITLPPHPPRTPSTAADAATSPSTPSAPHVMTVILDPVANTITRLNAKEKIAFVETVPADFFKRAQAREQAAGTHVPKDATATDLGSKTISGVVASGKRIVHTFPARDGETAHTMTHEIWTSSDLRIEVSSTETGDRGTHTNTLTALTKAEPDASLFKVPEGYTVKAVSMHGGFHGDHRGPGGPGSPDGDAAAPPQGL